MKVKVEKCFVVFDIRIFFRIGSSDALVEQSVNGDGIINYSKGVDLDFKFVFIQFISHRIGEARTDGQQRIVETYFNI